MNESMFSKFTIGLDSDIRAAVTKLNSQHDSAMTLFVLDHDNKLAGTVTDGDIRRGIVSGLSLDSPVEMVMNMHFVSLCAVENDIETLRRARDAGIALLPRTDRANRLIEIYNLTKIRSLLPIDAVIMAGGKGERLRPLTNTTPKPLLKIGEKAIIDHNIERLMTYGVKNITVTTNYLAEQIESHFKNTSVDTIREPKFLGTMGSIQFVKNFTNDTILVMNSDLFTNINFEHFYVHFKKNDADMSVAAVPYTVAIPLGILELEGHDVKGIDEKPTFNYYANAGIYLIKREIIDTLIPQGEYFDATDLIQTLLDNHRKVIRFPLTGYWIDIGNKQDYDKAQDIARHLK